MISFTQRQKRHIPDNQHGTQNRIGHSSSPIIRIILSGRKYTATGWMHPILSYIYGRIHGNRWRWDPSCRCPGRWIMAQVWPSVENPRRHFDGSIVVTARNRLTGDTRSYNQQLEDILTSGKESTAGIVWKEIVPGTYDIIIEAVNRINISIDKYENATSYPGRFHTFSNTSAKSMPGFERCRLS